MTPTTVHGHHDPRFQPVADELARQVASGEELGASIAVTVAGRTVVDIWAGHVDDARETAWSEDTITNVWSTTKTVTALAALILVDRGELELDAPVARYWPEFAAAGKEGVLVRHVLAHTSGLPGWAEPVTPEILYDTERSTALLAAQAPWWAPGTASGYHLLTYGHLVGEIVRRVSGQRLADFVRTEITKPLGADFHIGLDPSEHHRISPVVPPPPTQIDLARLDPRGPAVRTLANPPLDAAITWTSDWRTAEVGAANGHGNARSVARIHSVVTNGGEVDGVRLLSTATIDRIFEEQSRGTDLVLGLPLRFGIGLALDPASPRTAYWGGWGGSLVVDDVARQTTVAYVMNRMSPGIIGSPRSDAYRAAVSTALAHG